MTFDESYEQARKELEGRGLSFETFVAEGQLLSFDHPAQWRVDWREDHAVVSHGIPPQGFLTVHPLTTPPGESPEHLLKVWLNEYLGPASDHLNIQQLGPLPLVEGTAGTQFEVVLAGRKFMGVGLATRQGRQDKIAAYWVESERFRKPLVTSLVTVALGSLATRPGGPLAAPLPLGVSPLTEDELWGAEPTADFKPVGIREGRFALKLPPGWDLQKSEEEDTTGWVLIPPVELPGVVVLSSEDLFGELEDTLSQALAALDPEGVFHLELPALEVEQEQQRGLLQLKIEAADSPGPIRRLWSLGKSDGESVVHLLALGHDAAITTLAPDLARIGHSLRVLPRPLNRERMEYLTGGWFYHTYPHPRETRLVAEHRFNLQPDGLFELQVEERWVTKVEGVDPTETPNTVTTTGRWYVVGENLTLRYDDGQVEVRNLDKSQGRLLVVDGMIWARQEVGNGR